MRIYVFENFPCLPWAEIAVMLIVILLIVLAIRARRQLWKNLLTLCVPVLVIISCAGGAVAIFYHPPLVNISAPVPDSLSLAFVRNPYGSAPTLSSLNARTGATRWQYAIDGSSTYAGTYAGTFSVADEHTIYLVADQPQTIVAVRASDGQELWRTPLTNSLEPQTRLRFLAPPIVSDGMLFLSASAGTTNSDNAPGVLVFALRADTGALAWSLPLGGPVTVGQGLVFVGVPFGNISAFHERDGALVWRKRVAPDGEYVQGMPTFGDGMVISVLIHSIVALNARDGSPAWLRPLANQWPEDPVSVGANSVYYRTFEMVATVGETDYLNSLNAQTGNLQWRYKVVNASGSTAVEAGTLVYYASDRYLDAVRVSDGRRVWRHSSNANVGFGTPVILNGVLFVKSSIIYPHYITSCPPDCEPPSAVNALNATTGAVYWRISAPLLFAREPVMLLDTST